MKKTEQGWRFSLVEVGLAFLLIGILIGTAINFLSTPLPELAWQTAIRQPDQFERYAHVTLASQIPPVRLAFYLSDYDLARTEQFIDAYERPGTVIVCGSWRVSQESLQWQIPDEKCGGCFRIYSVGPGGRITPTSMTRPAFGQPAATMTVYYSQNAIIAQ